MSDNPTMSTFGFCLKCGKHLNVCRGEHAPQPPAPRISEEEIQRVSEDISRAAGLAGNRAVTNMFAAILRTLNEEKKA